MFQIEDPTSRAVKVETEVQMQKTNEAEYHVGRETSTQKQNHKTLAMFH